MEQVDLEGTGILLLPEGGALMRVRRIAGAVALLAGALALFMHGPGILL